MSKDFLTEEELVDTAAQYFKQDYRERGKVKWNGFFLSDHTAKLKKKARFQQASEAAVWQPKMTFDAIQEQVRLAFERHRKLCFQEREVDSDNRIPLEQVGYVTAFYSEGFYLDERPIEWESVRFAEVQHDK
ncbi:hypothetical protein [Fructobacillus papyrifericola]|uniref:DNA-directed RNA polymerase beta subunit n=1 Tax=Fructobacillus papyrifericola TaxID=2713172 RepID=A0ABS5QRZ2_9LACO|nr:hypothetical protein [Fructobacillus papyrifericola]MBS9335980.1 hypothetical protein [Fructobacillus papyrifericola]